MEENKRGGAAGRTSAFIGEDFLLCLADGR